MAKKARKKKSTKKPAVKRTSKRKSQTVAKTKGRVAAKTRKKAAKKRARKAEPHTLGERVSSAVKAVLDTFTEAEQLREKMDKRGGTDAE